ncbi:MAG: lasso RiPP family leader peptide-containing protein [Pseudonocardiaceae bacterium]
MDANTVEPGSEQATESYERPELTVVGEFSEVTRGSNSREHSDDGDAGGYWAP